MLADLSMKISSGLELAEDAVALAFVESPPEGMPVLQDPVPSACSLWRRAASGIFYAPAEAHYNCSIGAMTMGFPMPDSVKSSLQETVELMTSEQYLEQGEPAEIPVVSLAHTGIVYGPLQIFPIEPDLVLLWLSPAQAMLVIEAAGNVQWTASTQTQVYGRPACAALPVALNSGNTTISLGCQGMRTFTAISPDRMLAVVPGADLERFADALTATVRINETMGAVYDERNAPYLASAAN